MRNIFMFFFFLLLVFVGCNGQKKFNSKKQILKEERPNILWIVAEDLSSVLPPFGDSTVVTPNISRLAAEGVKYTNVFSTSGVCSPSRSTIATGMYPNGIGAHHMRNRGNVKYLPEGIQPYDAMPSSNVIMHSEYLRRVGYYCSNNSKEDYQFEAPVTAWDESSKNAHWRNRESNQPFFAVFNLGVTHESQIWAKAQDSLWVDDDLDVPIPPYLPDNEVGRTDVRRMYSNIKEMDYQVGEILSQLEEDGLMENTIIFWYTDHGGPLPRQKRLLYDSGMKVPLIIRYPGKKNAGKIDDRMISFVDFVPTLLSLVGIEPPKYLNGRAFLGKFESDKERKYVHGGADRFDEQYDMVRAVRDNRFKYLKNFRTEQGYYLPIKFREQMPIMKELLRLRDNGELNDNQAQWFRGKKAPEELFDISNDPYELNNLAENPKFQDKLNELRAECERWMTEINDKGLMSEKEYIASIWPKGVQPMTDKPIIIKNKNLIEIFTETEGASIGYQVLGKDEGLGETWKVYTEPFAINSEEKVISLAHRIGYLQSEKSTFSSAD